MANTINRAIVIGGSITGLLTAKVLSAYCEDVVIIERDHVPDTVTSRGGVPQDRHGHLLMARGQQIMEAIVPQLTDEFKAAGLSEIRWGLDTRVLMSGGWMAIADTGIRSYAASRLWLENALRKHILATKNIRVIEQATVTGLMTDATQRIVKGIAYDMQHEPHYLKGDLVIDCTGRRSKSADWLQVIGYDAVPTETIDPKMGYATRWYQKPADLDIDWKLYISYARPDRGFYRSGAIVEVEDDTWQIILGGTNGDYAPTDEDGYDAFLKSLPASDLYDYLQQAEPISPIYGYRHTANHWRHYEKMTRLPEQFIVMGDAVCAFNPVYAQGMSVSAIEVDALRERLARSKGNVSGDFTQRFQKHLASIIRDAWQLSATADALLPEATGDKPHPVVMIGQQYMTKLTELMPTHPQISATFLKIMHMQASPLALFQPSIVRALIRYQVTKTFTSFQQSDDPFFAMDDTLSTRP